MYNIENYIIHLKRRVSPELLEAKFQRALDYVTKRFSEKTLLWNQENESKFVSAVMNVFMDQLHSVFSDGGREEFPYVDILNYFREAFLYRILTKFESIFEP